jgi:hypothetical protein
MHGVLHVFISHEAFPDYGTGLLLLDVSGLCAAPFLLDYANQVS